MDINSRKFLATLIACSILLVGCTGESDQGAEDISAQEELEGTADIEIIPETLEIEGSEFCDDTNQIHCMLPFPSGAFLSEDSSQDTGFRLSIDGEAIPDSRSSVSDNMVILDRLDGFSPSTQIFTAFEKVPNITGLATQFDIEKSLMDDHRSVLLNMDTGEKVFHWIEVDARAQEDEETLLFLSLIHI